MSLLLSEGNVIAATRDLKAVSTEIKGPQRVALVIGNAKYSYAPELRNPVNDAKSMSDALKALGFNVIEVTDATQKEMNRAIAKFGEKLTSDSYALFFYAGHGLQVKGKNFLVPIDAQISGEAAVRAETVDVDIVMDQIAVSSLSIVVLDACRNNPFERSFRKMGGGLAQMDAPKGSFVAYATSPGMTAADGDGKNGLFTQELLKQLEHDGYSLETVFKKVRANVSRISGDKQIPWDSSSLTGDFYFRPSVKGASAAPVRIQSTAEIEQEAWEMAKNINTPDAYKTYLEKYADGKYSAQAKISLRSLQSQNVPQSRSDIPQSQDGGSLMKQQILWLRAQSSPSDEAVYKQYLEQYPDGIYASIAHDRLDALKKLGQKREVVAKEMKVSELIADYESLKDKQVKVSGSGLSGSGYLWLTTSASDTNYFWVDYSKVPADQRAELMKKCNPRCTKVFVTGVVSPVSSNMGMVADGLKVFEVAVPKNAKSVLDLQLDYESFKGKKTDVFGLGLVSGYQVVLSDSLNNGTSIYVDFSKIPRDRMKELLSKCNPRCNKVLVRGIASPYGFGRMDAEDVKVLDEGSPI